MLLTIDAAVAAEDVRHFQLRAIHEGTMITNAGVEWAGPPSKQREVTNRVGSMSSTLCWSRCGDILLWSPGCGGPAAAGWCARRCPIQASEPRRRDAMNA